MLVALVVLALLVVAGGAYCGDGGGALSSGMAVAGSAGCAVGCREGGGTAIAGSAGADSGVVGEGRAEGEELVRLKASR